MIMETSLGDFVILLLSVITLATAAGVGFQRGVIGRLRGDVSEAAARADRLAVELAESRTTSAQLRTDLDALSRVVTGEAHWVAIGDKLDEHHSDAQGHWRRNDETLERIARAVERRGQ
jgi:hypothetical protein